MLSNLFVIFIIGLRCLDITNDVSRYSRHSVYRSKHKRQSEQHEYDEEDGKASSHFTKSRYLDTDRWNEGIDAKFINRLLARLLIHWNYSWTDPVPASNRIILALPYIKYDENFHEGDFFVLRR